MTNEEIRKMFEDSANEYRAFLRKWDAINRMNNNGDYSAGYADYDGDGNRIVYLNNIIERQNYDAITA